MTNIEKEYETLRHSVLQWQSRRFELVGATIVVTTAILGWIVSSPNSWSWAIACTLPLSFLSSASFLTLMFNRYIVMISTYLEVFHVSAWNVRARAFRNIRTNKVLNLTTGLAFIYLGLGVISIVISIVVCTKPVKRIEVILFSAVCLLFIIMLVVLAYFSYPRTPCINLGRD